MERSGTCSLRGVPAGFLVAMAVFIEELFWVKRHVGLWASEKQLEKACRIGRILVKSSNAPPRTVVSLGRSGSV